MTGRVDFRAKPPISTERFLPSRQTFVRPPAAGAMLPWLPHASALLAQTLRNNNVVMNQHLCREPGRRTTRHAGKRTDSLRLNGTSHFNVKCITLTLTHTWTEGPVGGTHKANVKTSPRCPPLSLTATHSLASRRTSDSYKRTTVTAPSLFSPAFYSLCYLYHTANWAAEQRADERLPQESVKTARKTNKHPPSTPNEQLTGHLTCEEATDEWSDSGRLPVRVRRCRFSTPRRGQPEELTLRLCVVLQRGFRCAKLLLYVQVSPGSSYFHLSKYLAV